MKKLLVIGMILLLTGCTIIVKPDCGCVCPSKVGSWYWQSENYPVMPVPNDFTLPNLEGYQFKNN